MGGGSMAVGDKAVYLSECRYSHSKRLIMAFLSIERQLSDIPKRHLEHAWREVQILGVSSTLLVASHNARSGRMQMVGHSEKFQFFTLPSILQLSYSCLFPMFQ